MIILDGKKLSTEIASSLREAISHLDRKPKLLIIKIGENKASDSYIKQKIKFAEIIDVKVDVKNFADNVDENEVIEFIKESNNDSEISGIIVQLPIPKNLNQRKILDSVDFKKDVDGIGLGKDTFVPATTRGIANLLNEHKIDVKNKNVVIINDSDLVGKPTAKYFSEHDSVVKICNDQTENIKDLTKSADIVITGIGQPEIIDESYLKDGQVIIDVGITKTENGIKGDVKRDCGLDFKAITPVPGGVGPMTVASLFQNLLDAHIMQQK